MMQKMIRNATQRVSVLFMPFPLILIFKLLGWTKKLRLSSQRQNGAKNCLKIRRIERI